MDFKAAREDAGLTLEKAAELADYGISTINALELKGRGSPRLRRKLTEIYGLCKPADVVANVATLQDAGNKNLLDEALLEVQTIRDALNDLERKLKKLKS